MVLTNEGPTLKIAGLSFKKNYEITIPTTRVLEIEDTELGMNVFIHKNRDKSKKTKTIIYCSSEQRLEIKAAINGLRDQYGTT